MRIFWVSLFVLFSGVAHALYNGNPSAPLIPEEGIYMAKEAVVGVRMGYEGDFVFDRRMHHCEKFQWLQNFGTFTLNLEDTWDIYGAIGGAQAKIDQHLSSTEKVKYETHTGLMWQAGVRGRAAHFRGFDLCVYASYAETAPALKKISVNGRRTSSSHAHLRYREGQAALGLSRPFEFFIPYIGVEGSCAHATFKNLHGISKTRFTLHSKSPVGIFFGCGFSSGSRAILNVEARLIDQQALTLSGDIRF